jgi:DUF1365 family protein
VVTTVTARDPVTPPALSTISLPALYVAEVAHVRRTPITNRFRYRAAYWLVDYDQRTRLPGLLGRLVRFERSDHCDARTLLAQHNVEADRILMLAMPRTFGHVFNPISVFWCYDPTGTCIAVLAEVHNTYGGRHTYLLRPDDHGKAEVDKVLYVSPFYPVDGRYVIQVSEPLASLSVTVTLHRERDTPFVASLHGRRRATTGWNMARAALMYPALRTSALIRWQAMRLWLRGLKVQPR